MRCNIVILIVLELCTMFFTSTKADWEQKLLLETFNTKPNRSMVVAVLPLRLIFCKLASIAEGKTKEQLIKALGFQPSGKVKINSCYSNISEMMHYLKQSELIMLNKIYVNYSSEVDSKFLTNGSSAYGVNVEFVGFNLPRTAFSYINNGISTATFRRITDVVEHEDITPQTKMMIITAAHLRCTWEFPFDVKRTEMKKFHHLDNRVTEIPMMVLEDSFQLYENRDYKILSLRMQSLGASVTLVLPSLIRGMPGFLANLKNNPNLIKNARASMTIQQRKLVLPRFKIKSFTDLTEHFRKSSVSEILNSNSSDLDGMLKEEFRSSSNMFVSKIKQKLFLEFDELGVARHPLTAVDQYGVKPEYHYGAINAREFSADRPFYFIIDLQEQIPSREKLTIKYHQLFAGVYYGPE